MRFLILFVDRLYNWLEEYLDKVADKYFIKAIIVNIDLPDLVDMPEEGGE